MCLKSKWRFPRRAKKDIVCYKILCREEGDNYYTPYTNFKVDINIPLKATESSLSKNGYLKSIGYIHTYSSLEKALDEVLYFPSGVIFKCIIPKGTKYHRSRTNIELCSKQIKFIHKLRPYELYNIH